MFIDIFDMLHYLIGLIIVFFLIWIIIKIHNHFSKNNLQIPIPATAATLAPGQSQPQGQSIPNKA